MFDLPHLYPYCSLCLFSPSLLVDAESLIASSLEPKSQLICVIPMHVKYIPEEHFKGPATLWAYLPHNLSPSVRGTLFKFAYKVVVAVQVKNINSEIKSHLIQLPLRILPSKMMYQSLRIEENDAKKEGYPPDHSSNPFWVPDTRDENSYFSFAFDECSPVRERGEASSSHLWEEKTARSSDELSPSVSQCEELSCSDQSAQDAKKVYIYPSKQEELMNVLANSPPANFVISTSRGRIGRLSFQRTLLCLGDMIRGYFDFNEAVVPCFTCVISLESEEKYMLHSENPFLLSDCKVATRNDEVQNYSIGCIPLSNIGQSVCTNFQPLGTTQYTAGADITLNCISKLMLPFTIPIPSNITPQFHSVSLSSPYIALDYRWRLHLEFDLISESSKKDVFDHLNGKTCVKRSYGTVWTFPSNIKTEKFTMDIPVQLVLSTPSVIDYLRDDIERSLRI
uniref:Rgp1 domain-containing protein n=1 Tax=Trichobilharzia regenti TaxID=157069 RepID=A0AA85IQ33_TRIRE|nr:unnamed protein product [Trichobilharzia regenti]